jgi:hypothetical protein
MEKAGRTLNLKGHKVGDAIIYGPGDIEGHLGLDGNYYVVDFGRTFPPEAPPPPVFFFSFAFFSNIFWKRLLSIF